MTKQKIKFSESDRPGPVRDESSVEEVRDRLAGLLPDEALQDALAGLGPQEMPRWQVVVIALEAGARDAEPLGEAVELLEAGVAGHVAPPSLRQPGMRILAQFVHHHRHRHMVIAAASAQPPAPLGATPPDGSASAAGGHPGGRPASG